MGQGSHYSVPRTDSGTLIDSFQIARGTEYCTVYLTTGAFCVDFPPKLPLQDGLDWLGLGGA